jgi:hypothetical protein
MSTKQATSADTKNIARGANELADFMYGKFHEFPEDEKWATVMKLRNATNDFLFYVAQATGDISSFGAKYEWDAAHKSANAIKTMYVFAAKQNYVELDPDVVVGLDDLMSQIKEQSKQAAKTSEAEDKKELERWRKKHQIWKEAKK